MTGVVYDDLSNGLEVSESLTLTSSENPGPLSKYSVQLLLLVRLSLKKYSENGRDVDNTEYLTKNLVKPLTLEPRPPVVESSENIKAYTARFGASGFISRTNRNAQRGRMSGGSVPGMTRRSIIRQPEDDLWDMPCSEMGSLTLGDIREAESKMKAEDITLDQYVEKRREFVIKRDSVSPSQTGQVGNFAPISSSITNNGSVGNSSKIQHFFSTNGSQRAGFLDPGMNFCGQVPQARSLITSGGYSGGKSSILPERFTEKDPERPVSVIPSASNRKLSTFSEDFLKGPANLSLFDMNTPIFDDDCNDSVIDFYTPAIVSAVNKTTTNEKHRVSVPCAPRVVGNMEEKEAASTRTVVPTSIPVSTQAQVPATTSNFSWSNRVINHDDSNNRNSSNISNLSASFPALSKNAQIDQSQNKASLFTGSTQPLQIDSDNIIHRLQAAGLSSKLAAANGINSNSNGDRNANVYQSSYNNKQGQISKYNTDTCSSEYPPLSSASGTTSGYSVQGGTQQKNNQVKTNDAGRFLMSIIGAGQHKSDRDRNNGFGGY